MYQWLKKALVNNNKNHLYSQRWIVCISDSIGWMNGFTGWDYPIITICILNSFFCIFFHEQKPIFRYHTYHTYIHKDHLLWFSFSLYHSLCIIFDSFNFQWLSSTSRSTMLFNDSLFFFFLIYKHKHTDQTLIFLFNLTCFFPLSNYTKLLVPLVCLIINFYTKHYDPKNHFKTKKFWKIKFFFAQKISMSSVCVCLTFIHSFIRHQSIIW